MISLRSQVFPDFFQKKINYSQKTLFMGSCFAQNMGQKLEEIKIPTLINPFGVLYNPESITKNMFLMLENSCFEADALTFYNEKWISFSHHGSFSGIDKSEVLDNINKSLRHSHEYLKKTNILFITLGTAWIYRHIKTNEVVANCHKIPSKNFERTLLSSNDICLSFEKLIKKLKNFNPTIEIVFTVSPVRHWKDGPVNNQLSKSTLFIAVHELLKKYDFIHYFPSYEILMDDLRDYRFYSDDLFHPNQLAINYIWEKFCKTFFNDVTIETAKKVDKLRKNIEHKVFYPQTDNYKKFIKSNFKLIKELKSMLPNINFEEEKKHFEFEMEKYWPE